MSQAHPLEQYFLEFVNAERAKAGAQPLAFNGLLNDAAGAHAQWMVAAGIFSHTGVDGTNSYARMLKAGYSSPNAFNWGENIAWASLRGAAGYNDEVELLHTNLMNSPGHKANLLNADFREVGLGFEVGPYLQYPMAAFIVQDFARAARDVVFLTGVAFADKNGNGRYDPGEGHGGVTVTAVGLGLRSFSTVTDPAGGYALMLQAGTYQVTFSGDPIVRYVTIGAQNVKLDFAANGSVVDLPPPPPPPPPGPKPVILTGTPGRDSFILPIPAEGSAPTQIIGFGREDYIKLDNDIYTNWGSNTGVIMSSQFYVGPAAHDGTDRIMLDKATGAIVYDRDGTGPKQPVVIANIGKDGVATYTQFQITQ